MNHSNVIRTPVVVIVFNRPDLTRILFDKLASVRLEKIYIIVDGPRANNEYDVERRGQVLELVDDIKFANKIYINKSEHNMGCKMRVSSGLDWVFNNESEAIILEDDCIPQIDFLYFAELLLEKYRNDQRIGIISGTNCISDSTCSSGYFYSRFANIWGWATWKRVWDEYDVNMKKWSISDTSEKFLSTIKEPNERKLWKACFDQTSNGYIDTWDYQLWFSLWINSRLSIVPEVNLIKNLGFAHPLATHTGGKHPFPNVPDGKMKFPLINNNILLPDFKNDEKIRKTLYKFPSIKARLINKLKRILS